MPLMDNVGLLVKEALPMVVDILTRHGLRDRVKLITSGKQVTPAEVAWAYCAGADVAVSARGFMFALGSIQALILTAFIFNRHEPIFSYRLI